MYKNADINSYELYDAEFLVLYVWTVIRENINFYEFSQNIAYKEYGNRPRGKPL